MVAEGGWAIGLGYFRYIIGFIPYDPYFVIPIKFIMKFSPLPVVFSHKGFCKTLNLLFPLIVNFVFDKLCI